MKSKSINKDSIYYLSQVPRPEEFRYNEHIIDIWSQGKKYDWIKINMPLAEENIPILSLTSDITF